MTTTPPDRFARLRELGLEYPGPVHWDLATPMLIEEAVRREEGVLASDGPLVVHTGRYTGRVPKDKFFVREPSSEARIDWGDVNRPMAPEAFAVLKQRVMAYLQGRELFVENCHAGADPRYRLHVCVISQHAWPALFARNMFIARTGGQPMPHDPKPFTVLHVPDFRASPDIDGTRSEAFVVVHFGERLVLIGGTGYAGEIKKSIFTVMNYLLPGQGVMPMHCSATAAEGGEDAAVIFGLSGTGKTTLSADPERTLIGDDEHGWSDQGVFNFEGGCYAKVIRLSAESEPEIYATTRRFGTILENVVLDPATRVPDLDDAAITENTRAVYPLTHIPNSSPTGMAGHPRNIIMLTCDAFGVLPPVARLSRDQAMYHFLAGYTAKVAGTETGVSEPQATFSTCFGAPFMPLTPATYAHLLGEKIDRHQVDAWLINTGWSGGPYGTGQRIKLAYTRAMVKAVLTGAIQKIQTRPDPVFGLGVPVACPGVPSDILDPRSTWDDPAAYDRKARDLARMFHEAFDRAAGDAGKAVRDAGPIPTA